MAFPWGGPTALLPACSARRGRSGRPSESFTLKQAKALLATAESTRWHACVALSLLAGIRTEEARALRWDHVVSWVDDSERVGQNVDAVAVGDHIVLGFSSCGR
jgi:integrase